MRDGWKAIEKPQVVRNDRFHACLLEHDLGEPDAVEVAGSAPGQIAPRCVVPVEKSFAESLGSQMRGVSRSQSAKT